MKTPTTTLTTQGVESIDVGAFNLHVGDAVAHFVARAKFHGIEPKSVSPAARRKTLDIVSVPDAVPEAPTAYIIRFDFHAQTGDAYQSFLTEFMDFGDVRGDYPTTFVLNQEPDRSGELYYKTNYFFS